MKAVTSPIRSASGRPAACYRNRLDVRRVVQVSLRALCGVWLVVALVACAAGAQPAVTPITIRISGSTSMVPALRELADAYRQHRPNVRFELLGNGSDAGLAELKAGRVEIAAVSWQEEDGATPEGLIVTPFARDGIGVIVHPANRIAGLALNQVRRLYRGEILNWQALGGLAEEPMVISREAGSGTRRAFEAIVMAGEPVTLNAVVLPNSQAVVEQVARRPGAIGYVSMAVFTDTVRVVPLEDLLPTPANVRSGAYHLTRTLYLYSRSGTDPEVRRFLEFVVSPEGQRTIGRYHVALR